MTWPTERRVKSSLFWLVGLGLIIWNAVWDDQNAATFTVGLVLCGIPATLRLDRLSKMLPGPEPTVKEPVP